MALPALLVPLFTKVGLLGGGLLGIGAAAQGVGGNIISGNAAADQMRQTREAGGTQGPNPLPDMQGHDQPAELRGSMTQAEWDGNLNPAQREYLQSALSGPIIGGYNPTLDHGSEKFRIPTLEPGDMTAENIKRFLPENLKAEFDTTPAEAWSPALHAAVRKARDRILADAGLGDRPPVYYAGDNFQEVGRMSVQERQALQRRLADMGLLEDYWEGRVDQPTIQVMEFLMGSANLNGWTWEFLLDRMEEDPDLLESFKSKTGRAEFRAPAHRATDPAELASTVRQVFNSRLGRDPDDTEIAQLVAELQGWDKQSYTQDVTAARMQHEGQAEGRVVGDVSPVHRFLEEFEQRYRPELGFIERQEEDAFAQTQVGRAVGMIRGMV